MELHQKTLLEKRSFYLLSNKLKLYLKNGEGEQENYISYESLKGEAKISCRRNSKLLFLTIAMVVFSACTLLKSSIVNQGFAYSVVPLIIACSSGILYQYRQQNYIILTTRDREAIKDLPQRDYELRSVRLEARPWAEPSRRQVIFLRDKPNRQALEQFLEQLWRYRRRYLREKYFYINYNHDSKQQTERLRWLLEQNVISQAEYRFAQEDWIIDRSN